MTDLPDLTSLSETPTTQLKPRPDLVTLIVSQVVNLQESDPSFLDAETLYYAVKTCVNHHLLRPESESTIPTLFVYYLESYRLLQVNKKMVDASDQKVYTAACLSLFDLYLANPDELSLRRLVVESTQALHEVVTAIQSAQEDVPIEEALGNLTTIALIHHTIAKYLKSIRRVKNLPYIAWVKEFLGKATSTIDLSPLNEDPTTKAIVEQIKNRAKIITP